VEQGKRLRTSRDYDLVPVDTQFTSKFGFEGTTTYGPTSPYGINNCQVNVSFDPLAIGPGGDAMDTSETPFLIEEIVLKS
jgi:hypothetical protein